jgi:hypothetical protein
MSPAERSVVKQEQTKRHRQQIEESVIARDEDEDLERDSHSGREEARAARRKHQKGHNQLDKEHK